MFAVGKSIVDRSSRTNVGALMLEHGGGGHEAAGTCQIDNDRAEAVLAEIVDTIDAGERQASPRLTGASSPPGPRDVPAPPRSATRERTSRS